MTRGYFLVSESCLAFLQCKESALVSQLGCHPLANVATSDTWHSPMPIAACGRHHTSGSWVTNRIAPNEILAFEVDFGRD